MLLCYVYYFAFMLLCYIYFLNLCCYAMFFFLFIVACTPMPACPANYQRIGIPAGVAGAGTIVQQHKCWIKAHYSLCYCLYIPDIK
jgi:hypothetical protein